jgi:DnaJ-class molecular chaperone
MSQLTTGPARVCSHCDGFPAVRVTLGGRDHAGYLRTITVHCPVCHGTGTRAAHRSSHRRTEVAA